MPPTIQELTEKAGPLGDPCAEWIEVYCCSDCSPTGDVEYTSTMAINMFLEVIEVFRKPLLRHIKNALKTVSRQRVFVL